VKNPANRKHFIIEAKVLEQLFEALRSRDYVIVGPTIRDDAIVLERIESVEELPSGWTDEQDGGTYRLKKRSDGSLFGYVVGPTSLKNYFFPSVKPIWEAEAKPAQNDFEGRSVEPRDAKYAFVGARPCDIGAVLVQDRTFIESKYVEPDYKAVRQRAFIVAVNCVQAHGTCFCTSMGTGPKAKTGFDLALTEVMEDARHYFVVEVGSDPGEEVLNDIDHREADREEIDKADRLVADAAKHMGRELETEDLKELLYRNYESPRWNEVADRCLTCGNCTLICPTCFCSTVEDHSSVEGDKAWRMRKLDSCYNLQFSYLHGGSTRVQSRSRYRQWITHKLATWQDQFGTIGCIGCGRCITWCPVGIDITEEIRAVRAMERKEHDTGE
jgi:ferredoxin